MTNYQLITDDEIAKIKNHFRRNKDYYAVGGIMLVTGVVLGKKTRKPVSIDKAAILAEWMSEQVNRGYHIYALNDLQHNLWQGIYDYAEAVAKVPGVSVDRVLEGLLKEYESTAIG